MSDFFFRLSAKSSGPNLITLSNESLQICTFRLHYTQIITLVLSAMVGVGVGVEVGVLGRGGQALGLTLPLLS